jgi:tetratricopeptide (TPR) repeat protein
MTGGLRITRRSSREEARCAVCHDSLGAECASCERCASVFHAECRESLRACPTFGCGDRSTVVDPARRRSRRLYGLVGATLVAFATTGWLVVAAGRPPIGALAVAGREPFRPTSSIARARSVLAVAPLPRAPLHPETWRHPVEENPDAGDAEIGIAHLARAERLFGVDDRGALDASRIAVERAPWSSWAWAVSAEARRRTGDLGRAYVDATTALARSPSNALALRTRALVSLEQGLADEAMSNLFRLVAVHPSPEAARALALLEGLSCREELPAPAERAFAAGRFEECLVLTTAHDGTGNADLFAVRGEAHRRRGDDARALRDFDRALALDPELPLALRGRAFILIGRGEREEPRELLRLYLDQLPTETEKRVLREL